MYELYLVLKRKEALVAYPHKRSAEMYASTLSVQAEVEILEGMFVPSQVTEQGDTPDQAKSCKFCSSSVWDNSSDVCWYHQNNPPGR